MIKITILIYVISYKTLYVTRKNTWKQMQEGELVQFYLLEWYFVMRVITDY